MNTAITKITLSGEVASGKSTVGKIIADRLAYDFMSIGNKTRESAKNQGLTIVEFQKKCMADPELDKKIDLEFSTECNALSNIVIDYRMGFYFIPDAYHVFLKISEEEATERLMKAQRENESHFTVQERNMSFKNQFLSAYNIDYTDESNYDLILEVSRYSGPDEIAEAILQGFRLKKEKKIMYIDLDGVVCDFDKAVVELCPDLINMDVIDRAIKVEQLIQDTPLFFQNLPPFEGAVEAVRELFELYDVYFLSTPMWAIPESYSGKRIWIERYFGELSKKRLILTHRKDLVMGDFLIDDRMLHGVTQFAGRHIHFGSTEFPDWKTTFDYLRNIT